MSIELKIEIDPAGPFVGDQGLVTAYTKIGEVPFFSRATFDSTPPTPEDLARALGEIGKNLFHLQGAVEKITSEE